MNLELAFSKYILYEISCDKLILLRKLSQRHYNKHLASDILFNHIQPCDLEYTDNLDN